MVQNNRLKILYIAFGIFLVVLFLSLAPFKQETVLEYEIYYLCTFVPIGGALAILISLEIMKQNKDK